MSLRQLWTLDTVLEIQKVCVGDGLVKAGECSGRADRN